MRQVEAEVDRYLVLLGNLIRQRGYTQLEVPVRRSSGLSRNRIGIRFTCLIDATLEGSHDMSSGAVEFVKSHPLLSGAAFVILGVLASSGGIKDAKAYEEMLGGKDVPGRVLSVSEGFGSKRGKYSVEYDWTDEIGDRYQGKTTARSDFLGTLQAGDRVVLGVDPVDPSRAKPKEYMRERKPVRLGPLEGTDTLYVGALMVVSGLLIALFLRE